MANNGNQNMNQGNQGVSQGTGGVGQGQVGEGIGSPISNEAYNIISALHAKLEGLEAYRKYAKDGDAGVWKQLTQTEIQGVHVLVDELERVVRDGKLRMGTPGQTGKKIQS